MRRLLFLLLLVACGAAQAVAPAAPWPDPAARAGRLSDFQGSVLVFDPLLGQWAPALRNRPLATGDRLATEPGARAELRIGSTELRLGARTQLELVDVDGERLVFQLASGSLAVRVRAVELARQVEVLAAGVRVLPQRAGHYRIDREDDVVQASAWRGTLIVVTPDQSVPVPAGRRAEFMWEPRSSATVVTWNAPALDAFSDWVARDEQRDDRSASAAWVSPEMTGVEDLDRHGRWERHPEYGMVWTPLVVAAGWAPFRDGRWVLHARWGWTWVDAAPWGFAPFHYGSWVRWGPRWAWWPGPVGHRPVLRHERHPPGFDRHVPTPVVIVPAPPSPPSLPPRHWPPAHRVDPPAARIEPPVHRVGPPADRGTPPLERDDLVRRLPPPRAEAPVALPRVDGPPLPRGPASDLAPPRAQAPAPVVPPAAAPVVAPVAAPVVPPAPAMPPVARVPDPAPARGPEPAHRARPLPVEAAQAPAAAPREGREGRDGREGREGRAARPDRSEAPSARGRPEQPAVNGNGNGRSRSQEPRDRAPDRASAT